MVHPDKDGLDQMGEKGLGGAVSSLVARRRPSSASVDMSLYYQSFHPNLFISARAKTYITHAIAGKCVSTSLTAEGGPSS